MTSEDLASLHAVCFPDAPFSQEQVRSTLSLPATRFLAANDAFLIASVVAPEAEIITMGVHPRARRTGQARRLIETLQGEVSTIFLEVAVTNHSAIALYQRTGFVATGRRPDYYRGRHDPVDALCMTWTSAAAGRAIYQESVDPPTC